MRTKPHPGRRPKRRRRRTGVPPVATGSRHAAFRPQDDRKPDRKLIDKLTRSATGETRRGLLCVGAAYAALLGWLYQDAGDLSAAAFWRGITQETTLRARAPHLIG
ncbi:hypothetical protein GCM10022244_05290 [Streptomyces gulbargensis]|uniref:Uncharacterized protein n=2 Tax=Streptomyces gulbargensis TaxID=364901 RepID=A0ABP7LE82_9ACTN